MNKLLVIGHTFPEPATTAAGGRMMQLLSLFIEDGYAITFVSTSSVSDKSVDLSKFGIDTQTIKLNDNSFDTYISELQPQIVLFDRYITEEQFGWRVTENCPDAIRILDTEDLHFLRKAREEAVKKNIPASEANLFTETAKREIASILRSDLSLIISEFELDLLKTKFQVSAKILHYLPFLIKNESKRSKKRPKYSKTSNFITVGNLLHKPNIDAVLFLKKEIWPLIRKQLPVTELHIYGAYAPQHISELHNEKEGFLIKGWVEDLSEVMQNARICLAPLQYGAGLKGKIFDAMIHGTPSVTTTIGAEGIHGGLPFSGVIKDDPKEFAEASVELYTNEDLWQTSNENGQQILQNRFKRELFSEDLTIRIKYLEENLRKHRESNFIGQLLQHHSLQASKFMSKWIEAKNN